MLLKHFNLAALILVSACASQQGFDRPPGHYVGYTEVQLVEELGPPSNVHETEKGRFLGWKRPVIHKPSYNVSRDGVTITRSRERRKRCMLVYKLEPSEAEDRDGPLIVTSFHFEGGGCRP